MQVTVRRFRKQDIENKVRWINDPPNHRYLHYELPLTVEGTERWYRRVKDDPGRFDGVIVADGTPCGLIGLLHIDPAERQAEMYILVGESALRRRGVAMEASRILLHYAFSELSLQKVCLFTETGNLPAQRLFEKLGFVKKELRRRDVFANGSYADRFLYAMDKRPEWASEDG